MADTGLCQGCGRTFSKNKYTGEIPYHMVQDGAGVKQCLGSNMLPQRKELLAIALNRLVKKIATDYEAAVITRVIERAESQIW